MIISQLAEHWEHVTPFLAFPAEVRRVIYTTDESVKGRGVGFRVVFGRCSVLVAELGWLREGVARRQGCRRNSPGRVCEQARACAGVRDRRRWRGVVLRPGCQLALRFGVGVVDPGAKRRFWD